MSDQPFAYPAMRLPGSIARIRNGQIEKSDVTRDIPLRSILKGGFLVDPLNKIESPMDLAFIGGRITEVAEKIYPESGDLVYNVHDLLICPGLLDMHVHLGDLFEVTTEPIVRAAADGVTIGLSPGAGNTFMAPALLGAEVDRGLPMHVGVYLGAASSFGTSLSNDELVSLFNGTLDEEISFQKMTRNPITFLTAPMVIGIKDHIGHWIATDMQIERIYDVTSRAGLVFMSHTQDPAHSERLAGLSKGRPVHLAHANAAGCGTHDSPVSGMRRITDLLAQPNISGEFVTSMLRPGGGNREGLLMPKAAQEIAYEALADGKVTVMVSDGQGDATMKGFGDTRDNVPCILELAEMGVLDLTQAVATMTINPARLLARLTRQGWWTNELGHLGVGARANITVIDRLDKSATFVFVDGTLAGFENRLVRKAYGAGGLICKYGIINHLGVGDLPMRD